MKTIYESDSTPAADGFSMPAEFAPQERVWMGWPHRTDTWAHGAKPAQRQYAAIARAIAEFTPVTMCANEADFANCLAVFEDDDNVTVIEMTTNDAWFRDTGATFVTDGKGGNKRACDWHFNAYGGLIDGLYFPWDADDQIAAKMAQLTRLRALPSRRHDPRGRLHHGGRRGHRHRHRPVPALPGPHRVRRARRGGRRGHHLARLRQEVPALERGAARLHGRAPEGVSGRREGHLGQGGHRPGGDQRAHRRRGHLHRPGRGGRHLDRRSGLPLLPPVP